MNNNISLEDLIEKYLDCCKKGSNPDIQIFAAQYPEFREELLEILPLMNDLEYIGKNSLHNLKQKNEIPHLTDSDYNLLKKIGIGGMGIVYEAEQLSLRRKVAVKILSPSFSADTNQLQQFEKEARIIAMLHHPNIVKVYSTGCSGEYYYYAMELIEGKGLNKYKINNIREIAKIGLQAAKALAYAHSCKVIHRDIKPSNLLLDLNGQVRVGDFGLACITKDNFKNPDNLDSKSGTLKYMAPEKLSQGINSFLTDQYSLGATLYEITAQTPFIRAKTKKELINKICSGNLPKLSCKESDFAAIVNKCISYNPENRYKNMEELAEDLKRFLNNEPVSSAHYSLWQKYKLWKKRKPSAALYALIAALCTAAFVLTLCIGYIQTNKALSLAQKNAKAADTTLSKVFNYIENQTPTASGSILLDTLLPYYQEIAVQNDLPEEKLIEANKIVGLYAIRTGNYKLAEKAYRKLSKFNVGAYPLNQLAEALQKLGKIKEADKIRNQLINKYSNSNNTADKYEVVRALLFYPDDPEKIKNSYFIIKSLLKQEPHNSDYLYAYALILENNPSINAEEKLIGIEQNPVLILNKIAEENPANLDYSLAIIEIINKKLSSTKTLNNNDLYNLELALYYADKLLAEFPNTPKVVSSVTNLKKSYIRMLRRNRESAKARKETEALLGMLELLFYKPETPDSAKECLIELQLDRLKLLKKINKTNAVNDLTSKIQRELNFYNGAKHTEFQQTFNQIIN